MRFLLPSKNSTNAVSININAIKVYSMLDVESRSRVQVFNIVGDGILLSDLKDSIFFAAYAGKCMSGNSSKSTKVGCVSRGEALNEAASNAYLVMYSA